MFLAITLSSSKAGRAASLAPDFKKAKLAAAKIFAVIDREPEIDNLSEECKKPKVSSIYINLYFHMTFWKIVGKL